MNIVQNPEPKNKKTVEKCGTAKALETWSIKQTDFNWNRFLICLFDSVKIWTRKSAHKISDEDYKDLINGVYTNLVEDFYEIEHPNKTKENKKAIAITKQYLLENLQEYTIGQTIGFLKKRSHFYCKEIIEEIIYNKYKKNFNSYVKNLVKKVLLTSNNKEEQTLAKRLISNKTIEVNDSSLNFAEILSKKSNKEISKYISLCFEEYQSNLKAKKGKAKKILIKQMITAIGLIKELENISMNQIADLLFPIVDGRNSIQLGLPTNGDEEEENDLNLSIESLLERQGIGGRSAESVAMERLLPRDNILMRMARKIINDYLPENQKKEKPKTKQIKAFLVHYATIDDVYMEKIGYPKESIAKILKLKEEGNKSKDHSEIKATIIGKILNERANTSLYQVEQFKKELQTSFDTLANNHDRSFDKEDYTIFTRYVLCLAVKALNNQNNNAHKGEKKDE